MANDPRAIKTSIKTNLINKSPQDEHTTSLLTLLYNIVSQSFTFHLPAKPATNQAKAGPTEIWVGTQLCIFFDF